MRVNLEYIQKAYKFIECVNSRNIDDIDWYLEGKKIDVSDDDLREFKVTGLSNIDFIRTGWFCY